MAKTAAKESAIPLNPPSFYLLRKVFPRREAVIMGVLLLEILLFWLLDWRQASGQPRFVSFDNLLDAARFTVFIGLAAIGATLVILTGGIDLSVGALFGLCGIASALTLSGAGHLPPSAALASALVVGASFGALNGAMVAYFRIPAFIVTLGTMSVARGLALLFTRGVQLPTPDRPFSAGGDRLLNALDSSLFATDSFGGIKIGLLLMIALAVLMSFALVGLAWGRQVHAIGGNEEAARYAGVRVARIKFSAYLLAGIFAGLSGLFYLARYKGINSGVTQGGWELDIIAAAVVGGVSLQGGKGSPLGAIIGALIIKVLDDGLSFHAVPKEFSLIAKGALIVLAVLVDQSLKKLGSAPAKAARASQ